MNIKELIGSGDKIGRLTLPVLIVGLILNILFPAWFRVGGPPAALKVLSIALIVPGLIIWLWSVALLLTKVPQHQLITGGPYSLVKHPLYTGVSLLVLPWLGFLLNSWLGALVGMVLYLASRRFAPEEERALARTFGTRWEAYCHAVKIPWI